jgi:hypothetical protein
MALKLVAATAVLFLSLVVPSLAGAHTQPPPNHRCRALRIVSTPTSGPCFVVSRLASAVSLVQK